MSEIICLSPQLVDVNWSDKNAPEYQKPYKAMCNMLPSYSEVGVWIDHSLPVPVPVTGKVVISKLSR